LALCAALVAGLAVSVFAIEYNEFRLLPHLDGDLLHVVAPNFSFLSGKALDRLKDGASVGFIAQLTVSRNPTYVVPDARVMARFAVSYDIWEERFSVSKVGDRPEQKRTASHLSGAAAEAWCFDKLAINRSELPADKPFYVQLDLRAEDPRDQSGIIGENGFSLSRMIEVFSQPAKQKQDHWFLSSGPIRLEDLIKGMHG
jgi:hypothetical protein